MYHSPINITRINNGYTVLVPMYPKPFESFAAQGEKDNSGKGYITTNNNIFYFETLEKVFDYLKSIEKNIPMDNFAYGNANPVMVG